MLVLRKLYKWEIKELQHMIQIFFFETRIEMIQNLIMNFGKHCFWWLTPSFVPFRSRFWKRNIILHKIPIFFFFGVKYFMNNCILTFLEFIILFISFTNCQVIEWCTHTQLSTQLFWLVPFCNLCYNLWYLLCEVQENELE
jgi:hypothetical protein